MKFKISAAVLFALIIICATAFADTATGFSDIPKGASYSQAVKYCFDNGLMTGTSDTEFSPNENTSRAMLVTILHRNEGSPEAKAAAFIDIAQSDWFYNGVCWAAENGIVNGYDDEHFAPNDLLTREQIIAVLWRYAGEETVEADLPYSDASGISDYAVPAVKWAYANDIVSDKNSTVFNPTEPVTRSEMAVTLYNYSKLQANADETQTPEEASDSENNNESVLPALSIKFGNNSKSFTMSLENNETTLFLTEFVGGGGINLPVYHFDDFEGSNYMQYYEIPSHYEIPAVLQSVTSQKAGDVYYADNKIILFYKDSKLSGDYAKIGHIENTDGLAEAVENNPVLEGWGNKIISISSAEQ